MGSSSAAPLTRGQVEQVIAAAIAAPSVLNTQPWRFHAHDGVIDVYAVPTRGLPAVDPAAREAHISCGAAVLNLRLALTAIGRTPIVRLLPDRENRAHVARVRVGGPTTPSSDERRLADAIAHRRTSRQPFSGAPVPQHVIDALGTAAEVEGARLNVVPAWRRGIVIRAVQEANLAQQADTRVSDELDRWTLHRSESDAGIPDKALGPRPTDPGAVFRDLALDRPVEGRPSAEFENEPLLAVVLTVTDDQAAWLRAGLALERVLLVATSLNVSAGLLTSPLEVSSLRRLLVDEVASRGHPQVLLRLGYGPEQPVSPRRNITAVLDMEDDQG
jgi:Nitroreductase family